MGIPSYQNQQERFLVRLNTSDACPPYGCLQITGREKSASSAGEADLGDLILVVGKPTAVVQREQPTDYFSRDSNRYVFAGPFGISGQAGGQPSGQARSQATFAPGLALISKEKTLATGAQVGPVNGKYFLSEKNAGFTFICYDGPNPAYEDNECRSAWVAPTHSTSPLLLVLIVDAGEEFLYAEPVAVQWGYRYQPAGWEEQFVTRTIDGNEKQVLKVSFDECTFYEGGLEDLVGYSGYVALMSDLTQIGQVSPSDRLAGLKWRLISVCAYGPLLGGDDFSCEALLECLDDETVRAKICEIVDECLDIGEDEDLDDRIDQRLNDLTNTVEALTNCQAINNNLEYDKITICYVRAPACEEEAAQPCIIEGTDCQAQAVSAGVDMRALLDRMRYLESKIEQLEARSAGG